MGAEGGRYPTDVEAESSHDPQVAPPRVRESRYEPPAQADRDHGSAAMAFMRRYPVEVAAGALLAGVLVAIALTSRSSKGEPEQRSITSLAPSLPPAALAPILPAIERTVQAISDVSSTTGQVTIERLASLWRNLFSRS